MECGAALATEETGQSDASQDGRYTTPLSTYQAESNRDGSWTVTCSLDLEGGTVSDRLGKFITNAAGALKSMRHAGLASLTSFDAEAGRCEWSLPAGDDLRPLSSLSMPRTPSEVRRLLPFLTDALDALHREGFGAFDLSPDLIYVDPYLESAVLIPTPWLASQARQRGEAVSAMPFVAPELADPETPLQPVVSDVYGLGALAGALLTGAPPTPGKPSPPGNSRSDLAGWDALVDSCCRSKPARRPQNVIEVNALIPETDGLVLPTPPVQPVPPPPDPVVPQPTPQPALPKLQWNSLDKKLKLAGLAALLLVATTIAVVVMSSALGIGSGIDQGFAGTVVRYADRSYEGAEWEKLKESDSLATLLANDEYRIADLHAIVGRDDDNIWVIEKNGVLFKMDNGHWELVGLIKDAVDSSIDLIDQDTLAVYGGRAREGKVQVIDGAGITPIDLDNNAYGQVRFAGIAPDLFYLYGGKRVGVVKFVNRKAKEVRVDKDQAAFIQRDDQTPIKEMPAFNIWLSRTFQKGEAYGIWTSEYQRNRPWLIRFEDGRWYQESEIPIDNPDQMNTAWLGRDGGEAFAVIVGQRGMVVVHRGEDSTTRHPINKAQEGTTVDLIAVWGTSPEKFWVMDRNGTVWEREGDRWRVVVRGLYDDDVFFKKAWVSPEGNVYALTREEVYQLQ